MYLLNKTNSKKKNNLNVFIPLIIVIIIFNEGYVLYMEYVYVFVAIGST